MAKATNYKGRYYRVSKVVNGERFWASSKDGKKAAEEKLANLVRGIEAGLPKNFEKITFGELFDTWFNQILKPSIKESSYDRYTSDYNLRIKNCSLTKMKLVDIKGIHVIEYYNGIIEEYSYNTMINTNKLIGKFFKYCEREEYVIKNPLITVELPHAPETAKKKVIQTLNTTEREKLDSGPFIFLLALKTGLRRGELLALQHKDIDLEEKTIHVYKTLDLKGKFTTPKTKSSIRDIPIVDSLVPLLKKHIQAEKAKHLKCGIPFSQDQHLFTSKNCTFIMARNLIRNWKRFCEINDIGIVPFKALRSTFGSMLCEKDVGIKSASVLMGHSTIKTTERFYISVSEEQKRVAISVLN